MNNIILYLTPSLTLTLLRFFFNTFCYGNHIIIHIILTCFIFVSAGLLFIPSLTTVLQETQNTFIQDKNIKYYNIHSGIDCLLKEGAGIEMTVK